MVEEQRPEFNFFTMFRNEFKNMTPGKTLWSMAIIKLIAMFLILRPFFSPDFLNPELDNSQGKSDYMSEELVNKPAVDE